MTQEKKFRKTITIRVTYIDEFDFDWSVDQGGIPTGLLKKILEAELVLIKQNEESNPGIAKGTRVIHGIRGPGVVRTVTKTGKRVYVKFDNDPMVRLVDPMLLTIEEDIPYE